MAAGLAEAKLRLGPCARAGVAGTPVDRSRAERDHEGRGFGVGDRHYERDEVPGPERGQRRAEAQELISCSHGRSATSPARRERQAAVHAEPLDVVDSERAVGEH